MNQAAQTNFLELLMTVSAWDILKMFFCLALLLYVVFAIVVAKQVQMMTQTLVGQLELPLRIIAAVHLVGAIFVLFLAIVIL